MTMSVAAILIAGWTGLPFRACLAGDIDGLMLAGFGVIGPWPNLPLVGIYSFCLVVGLGYVLLAALMGSLGGGHDFGHLGDFGHDLDAGHDLGGGHGEGAAGQHGGGAHLGPFSPLVVALFLTCFGGTGLLFNNVGLRGMMSLGPATGSAAAFAAAAAWLFNRLFRTIEATSQARACDMLGRRAMVITPIPKGPGAGAIAYVINGTRYSMTARSEDAVAMDRGAEAVILRVMGQSCFVAPPGDPRSQKAIDRREKLEAAEK